MYWRFWRKSGVDFQNNFIFRFWGMFNRAGNAEIGDWGDGGLLVLAVEIGRTWRWFFQTGFTGLGVRGPSNSRGGSPCRPHGLINRVEYVENVDEGASRGLAMEIGRTWRWFFQTGFTGLGVRGPSNGRGGSPCRPHGLINRVEYIENVDEGASRGLAVEIGRTWRGRF